ncbi:MAG TPA: helix-turn-helix transcriptional regulator [Gemmataceae bacterium]|nr:helix-turn-helix transcriptional regulator [Gemmataceae bacterium]
MLSIQTQRPPLPHRHGRAELPSFAVRARLAREHLGLSRRALAERAGLPIRRITEVERGTWPKRNYLKTLLAMARALGLKPSDLDERLRGEFPSGTAPTPLLVGVV